ncbi:hypothetical protein A2810_00260 [candidate division Kazan bacterium RIFCSPHIGHO2_01_FULL_49_10]|uniref:Uncharacterized protein n=1 Tax=candidate division Kazan bacterium RIFCSPLOWO2_01_FULL_48_13 TaxID=1798539 RepID=A0A1F4PPS0_UNCK3|nr:MAG: hypothetical protein A2810_00260 [candidate division Kazan bacterium RIFCSPHIGHO2_01_FULL_49_10]OGB85580.1 MAG: hypothetical protein A2994_00980 [candidate division Kazan bacterium RIFCSPLOWO2_01_FULL_48_13]
MNKARIILWLIVALLTSQIWSGVPSVIAFEQLPRSLAWELMGQSGIEQLTPDGYPYSIINTPPGATIQMSVKVRNRSRNPRAEVWYGKSALIKEGPSYPNAHAIGIGTWDPMDNKPSFLDASSFVINGNRLAYYDGAPVNKGGIMDLSWTVRVADNTPNGTYDLVLSLVREHDEWGYRVTPKGVNHKYRSILFRFVIGNNPSQIKTYNPQGSDLVFDYPNNWEIARDFSLSEENSSVFSSAIYLSSPSVPMEGDYPLGVHLVRNAGTTIDQAIQNFIADLNPGIWGTPEISSTLYTAKNHPYKHLFIRSLSDTGTIRRDFVVNEHNFVVTIGNDSGNNWSVVDIIRNSLR